MAIYKIVKNNLVPIKEKRINLEIDLQKLTDRNLEIIFGLKFVTSQFSLGNFRLDTLAFDEENKSFVIIEYKRDRSFSVIDQGFSYLSLMLHNKAEFILEYNEKMKGNLKRNDVDWSQSRVLFLAHSFTPYQRNAINFRDLPIELWEVRKYDNNIILFNQLKSISTKESISKISKNKIIEKVSKSVKVYSIDDHFRPGWEKSRELFEDLKEKILALDSRIEEKVNKYYIGYKITGVFYNICAIHARSSILHLDLIRVDKKDLDDPENKIKEVHWKENRTGKYCVYTIKTPNDIPYALFLIKQVYNKFYK